MTSSRSWAPDPARAAGIHPDDQKALSKTVRTYPKTDVYDLDSALTSLGIGEAVVTVLSEKGAPTPVAWTRMRVPRSLMASIGTNAIANAAKHSPLQAKYGQTVQQPAQPQAGPQDGQAQPGRRPPQVQSDYPPVPANGPVPPMPQPAEPKGPARWEEVLSNPTVKSGINTAIREVMKTLRAPDAAARSALPAAELPIEAADDRRDDGARTYPLATDMALDVSPGTTPASCCVPTHPARRAPCARSKSTGNPAQAARRASLGVVGQVGAHRARRQQ